MPRQALPRRLWPRSRNSPVFLLSAGPTSSRCNRSLLLVTTLAPVIGYDKASKIAHHASEHDLTLKEAALEPGFVDEPTFDRVVDPAKMVKPYVAVT